MTTLSDRNLPFQCKPPKANDYQVNGDHYKKMIIEPWAIMESVLTYTEFVGFLKGNLLKYALRQGRKPGADDDGEKAKHYQQKLDEVLAQGDRW